MVSPDLRKLKPLIVSGGIVLLESYLPPNDPIQCLPSSHPLLPSLTDREAQNQELRQKVIDIIESTVIQGELRRGFATLEKLYMGKLMKDLKGKVDAKVALEIIREEGRKRIYIDKPRIRGVFPTALPKSDNPG
jgi:hypothetical protein